MADREEERSLPYADVLSDAERKGHVLHRGDIYSSGPPVDVVSEEILSFLLEHAGNSILDVGCGVAPYVARMRDAGKRAVGVDIDRRAIQAARAMDRPVLQMSGHRLAFAAATFDTVVMVETLEHIPQFERVLAEAFRVARESVLVTVPDISVIPKMSRRQVVPWHLLEATHVNFFTPEILKQTLLRFARRCQVTGLGAFFEVDGEEMHMHIGAVAKL